MADGDLDLNTLNDDELVEQMHDDLYDGLGEEIVEGVNVLLKRNWTPYDILKRWSKACALSASISVMAFSSFPKC